MEFKIACCSTLNDLYFDGFVTFFYSLIKHNPSFSYDYYIFTWGELSEENKKIIQNIYPKFIFKEINNCDYEGVKYNTRWRNWNINCINRFEIFLLEGYERVIFLDVDMLVLKDITPLFNIDVEFGACETTEGAEMDHPSKFDRSLKSFDGGLMIISKKYLTPNTKSALIEIALQKEWSSDEPILNTYFDNKKTTFLPREYNMLSQELTQKKLDDAYILQFVGTKKPWFCGSINDRYDTYIISFLTTLFTIKVDMLYKQYYNEARKHYEL